MPAAAAVPLVISSQVLWPHSRMTARLAEIDPRRVVVQADQDVGQRGGRRRLTGDHRRGRDARARRAHRQDRRLQLEPARRANRPAEFRLVHHREHRQHVPSGRALDRLLDEAPAELRHRLEDQDAGFHGKGGHVVLVVVRLRKEIPIAARAAPGLDLHHLVDQHEPHDTPRSRRTGGALKRLSPWCRAESSS